MIYKVTKLKDINKNIKTEATLAEYIVENSKEIDINRKRPAILVCPGGGYGMVSDREAEAVALQYFAAGYDAFVLTYTVAPNGNYPIQLLEASASISYIRENADKYMIDVNKIIVTGFSAGGHLACSVGTLWNEKVITDTLKIKEGSNKPNAMILCYSVISGGDNGHKGSFENLIGPEKDNAEMFEYLSLENRVTKDTMPTFLWHTANDTCVPVENSLMFAAALQKNKVPFELHIFPDGNHGLSLCNELTSGNAITINPHCEQWLNLALNWIKTIF